MGLEALQIALLVKNGIARLKGDEGDASKKSDGSSDVFSRLLAGLTDGQTKSSGTDGAATPRGKGDWLRLFRDRLLAEGFTVGEARLDQKATAPLKRLLLAEGFDEKDVTAFLERLFQKGERREVRLSDLLEKVLEFRSSRSRRDSEVELEIANLPHVEMMLRSLGLEVCDVNRVIERSRGKGGDLDVKRFAREVKRVSKETALAAMGPHAEGEDKESDDASIRSVLMRMGMEKEASRIKGRITLSNLARIAENKAASVVSSRLSEEQVEKEIRALVDHARSTARVRETTPFHLEPRFTKMEGSHGEMNKKRAGQAHTGVEKTVRERAEADLLRDSQRPSRQEVKKEDLIAKIEDGVTAGAKGLAGRAAEKQDPSFPAEWVKGEDGTRPVRLADPLQQTASRPVPMHIVHQVGKQLGLSLKRGESQVRIQLKPPHLGSIQLDLAMKNHVLKLSIISEHQAVKDLLYSHVNELKEALVEQGIELQKVDVHIGYNFDQAMAHGQNRPARFPLGKGFGVKGHDESGDDTPAPERIAPSANPTGSLDMFA